MIATMIASRDHDPAMVCGITPSWGGRAVGVAAELNPRPRSFPRPRIYFLDKEPVRHAPHVDGGLAARSTLLRITNYVPPQPNGVRPFITRITATTQWRPPLPPASLTRLTL